MKRCTRCILPGTFPGITFNALGECSYCTQFDERGTFIPSRQKLAQKFEQLAAAQRSAPHPYHALVAFSGGKDSTFLIYILKKRYGLNILAFTVDNGFMAKESFTNMSRVTNALDVDHIVVKPQYELMCDIFSTCADEDVYPDHLTRFGSSICISCIRMVTNLSLRTALEKKIPMVMLGHSPGQLIQSENEIVYQDNKIPYQLRKKLFKPLADKLGDRVYHYLTLGGNEYKSKPFPYIVNALPILGYDEKEIYETIARLGWQRPGDVDPNTSNCRLNALGIARHQARLGFHPYDYEMSQLVRLKIIDRETALERVEDPRGKVAQIAAQVEKTLFSRPKRGGQKTGYPTGSGGEATDHVKGQER